MPSRMFRAAFAGSAALAGFAACTRTETRADRSLERAADDTVQTPFGVSIGALNDFDVVGPNGEKYGEVEYVLVDAAGAPSAVVVELDADRFGAERLVRMDVDQLSMRQGDGERALVSPLSVADAGRLETYGEKGR